MGRKGIRSVPGSLTDQGIVVWSGEDSLARVPAEAVYGSLVVLST